MRPTPYSKAIRLGFMGGFAALIVLAPLALARTDGEIRGGYYADAEEGFAGGGFLVDMGDAWYFNPNLEWVFVENRDYFTINADVHKDLNRGSGAAIWLGGGAGIIVTDSDFQDRNTDLGLNLLGGIGASQGSVRPFSQFKMTISDTNEASLAFGLRF